MATGTDPRSTENDLSLADSLRGLAHDPHARAVVVRAYNEAGLANAATALIALADALDAGTILRPRAPAPCPVCQHPAKQHYALGYVGCHVMPCSCKRVLSPGSSTPAGGA